MILAQLAKFVKNKAINIVVAVTIVTILFTFFLPSLTFETNLSEFLPDNELVRANSRVSDYFGRDYRVHYIYVTEHNRHNDILSAEAIREQYDIAQKARSLDGVTGTISIAEIINVICEQFPFLNKSVPDCTNEELNDVKDTLIGVLNGSINYTYYLQYIGTNSDFEFSMEDINSVIDIFLPSSFDATSNTRAKSTIILVQINGSISLSDSKQTAVELRDAITSDDYSELKLEHTGASLIGADIDENSNTSFILLGLGIIVFIVIVLALTFRRATYVILPLITLIIATVWTFGTMAAIGLEFTVIDVAVIPLIIGLGVDYSVHISRRYQEELKRGRSIENALNKTIKLVGSALILATITTVIAFMANITSDILPIRDFGIICGLGIFYAFLLTITFQSSCRYLIDKNAKKTSIIEEEKEPLVIDMGTKTASRSVTTFPVLIIILVAIITSGAFVLSMNVRTEFSDADFLPENWDAVQTQENMRDEFSASSYSQAFILIEADMDEGQSISTPSTLRSINDTVYQIQDDRHVVMIAGKARTVSIIDYIRSALENNQTLANMTDLDNDGIPDDEDSVKMVFDYLWNTRHSIDPLSSSTSTSSELETILHRDENGNYDATIIRVYVNTGSSSKIRKMYEELQDDLDNVDYDSSDTIVTGGAVLTITTMDSLQESQIISTVVAILFSVIILMVIYRSPILGLMSIVPVVLSAIWIVGTMYVFSISLNVTTVMVTALTIGLGLDYSIHIVERFREERLKKQSIESAIQKTIKNTGKALFISALTTIFGFIILIISPMPPIQNFGVITAITIFYSAGLAIVFLPIMLGIWAKRQKS
jgi:hydrophobe/amphiphile efflux-3 (HAE3) family protein